MRVVYLFLALVGAVGTWYFNIASIAAEESYLGGWFGSAASSSAAVDVIVVAIVACIFIIREGRRLSMAPLGYIALVPLSFMVAIAFTFPLFLAWREHHLSTADQRVIEGATA
ncbi:MAG: DUF2834 domain-containing protein [Ornithinimicrobium sp.]